MKLHGICRADCEARARSMEMPTATTRAMTSPSLMEPCPGYRGFTSTSNPNRNSPTCRATRAIRTTGFGIFDTSFGTLSAIFGASRKAATSATGVERPATTAMNITRPVLMPERPRNRYAARTRRASFGDRTRPTSRVEWDICVVRVRSGQRQRATIPSLAWLVSLPALLEPSRLPAPAACPSLPLSPGFFWLVQREA